MVYKVEGATPIRLAFWGSVGPRDLKPAAIRAGACVAARQPGWARRICGRLRRTRRVSAVRFQHPFRRIYLSLLYFCPIAY
jgi:hypothetical protein